MAVTRSLLAFAVVALLLAFVSADLPPCTADDMIYFYSPCPYLDSLRTLYYEYPQTCDRSAPSTPPLPDPVADLPCDVDCDAGEYLPYGETECAACDAGSFSLGGGIRLHDWPKTESGRLPYDTYYAFGTYCTDPSNGMMSDQCHGWSSEEYFLRTDLEGLSEVNMVLELVFYPSASASIGFEYTATSEHEGDMVLFSVSGEDPVILPMTAEPMYYSHPISVDSVGDAHWVLASWTFYKNPEVSNGEEGAQINFIELYGLTLSDDVCTQCPAGRFQSEEGMDRCAKCPVDTFSLSGAGECTPCSNTTFAFPGSPECHDRTGVCDPETDATIFYTPCSDESGDWTRTMYYAWKEPRTCTISPDAPLPDSVPGVDCLPCPAGTIHAHSGEEECTFCPEGTFSTNGKCETCPEGTAAVLELHYSEWNVFPDGFETLCIGNCDATGWELYEDFIGTGFPIGNVVDLLLTSHVNMAKFAGQLVVDFEVVGDSPDVTFYILVDGYAATQAFTTSMGGERQSVSVDLAGGHHEISFYFHRYDPDDEYPETGVKIYSIDFYGLKNDGGASMCTSCPAGYYQENEGESTCNLCSSGTASEESGSTSCPLCPENTFNTGSTPGCKACPGDTFSHAGARYCENYDCIYITEDRENYYNLSPYTGYEQYSANGDESFPGYFLVSYCAFLEDEVSPCGEDSLVCEVYEKFNPSDPVRNYATWADEVDFEERENPEDGFILHYVGGESEGCPGNQTRSLHLIFNCDPDSDNRVNLHLKERTSECEATLSTTSVFGCPVCDDEDFERVEGECEDGEMLVTYQKLEGTRCNGAKAKAIETCGELELNLGLVIGVSVGVIACIIFLVAAVALIFMKNRRLQTKYTLLQEQFTNEGEEMEEVEVSTEEDK